MKKGEEKKYFVWIMMIALLIVAFLIIRSFITPLISAFVLAYLMLPVFNFLNKKKIPKNFSSLICVLIVILIFLVPLGGILTGIVYQAEQAITPQSLETVKDFINSIPLLDQLEVNWQEILKSSVNFLINLLSNAAKSIPSAIISTFIVLIGIYYILIDWERISKNLKKTIPFKDKEKISKEISKATNNIIYGTILVSLIGFVISAVGFFLLGIDQYLFYAIIMALFLFIPVIGPSLLWVPLTIYYLINQDFPLAIGVLILGLIVSNIVDNLIRMKVVGKKAKINPLIMFVGILGGISLFGIFGFIIGPLILVYSIKILQEVLD